MSENLESIAATLVADGKGILAADESVATLTRRFGPLGIKSIEQTQRSLHYMHLADLTSYLEADQPLPDLYADADGWARQVILNAHSELLDFELPPAGEGDTSSWRRWIRYRTRISAGHPTLADGGRTARPDLSGGGTFRRRAVRRDQAWGRSHVNAQ